MAERPILFSGPMVRALLEGRKTQTRRIINPQPSEDWSPVVGLYHPTKVRKSGEEYPGAEVYGASDERGGRVCPYGRPGDLLWVKETADFGGDAEKYRLTYRADGSQIEVDDSEVWMGRLKPGKVIPSIYMPRWASRITLKVTEVRVQRLQDISEADAKAEGAMPHPFRESEEQADYRGGFRDIWEQINGLESWDQNPWLWCVTFEVLQQKGESQP